MAVVISEEVTLRSKTPLQNTEEASQEDLDDHICGDSQNEVETQNALQNSSEIARPQRILFNSSHCEYEVVIEAARRRGWRIIKGKTKVGRCHVHWIDDNAVREWIPRVDAGMRINHFPGMFDALGRKSCLARNMARMQRHFLADFKFLPQTWVLPHDMAELERQFAGSGVGNIFIVKPDNLSQGKGIFLTNELDKIKTAVKDHGGLPTVVQQYISKPMLIDGLKFDLRLYLLVCGSVTPSGLQLRCFLFKDGLVRLCTLPYEAPSSATLGQKRMHLTNYSINKKSINFQQNADISDDGIGNKRSLTWFMKYIAEEFGENEQRKLWGKFVSLCVKMMAAVEPSLATEYASAFPKDVSDHGGVCRSFQILGVDVMLDNKRKPFLIEVNTLPSFETDSPLDLDIKQRVVSQSFDLSCASLSTCSPTVDVQNSSEARMDRPEASQEDCDTYMDFERILPVQRSGKLEEQCKAILAHARSAFQGLYASSRPPKPPQAAGTPRSEKLGKMDVPEESRTENTSNERRQPTRRRTLSGPPRCASVNLPALLAHQPKQQYAQERGRSSTPTPKNASSRARELLHLKAVQIEL